MALEKINIRVDEVNDLMCDYTHVQVYRADSEYGTYSEISTAGDRPRLCEDTYYYTFRDTDSDEYKWYKWRYYNYATGVVSPFTRPIQTGETNTRYTRLSDVKRILMTGEKRISFSGGYKNIRPGRNNNDASTIELSSVTMHQDYMGHEQFTITFTSATDFTVTVTQDQVVEPRSLGTGSTASDFTSNDYNLFISSASWSGTAFTDDVIEFDTNSDMSTKHALAFIRDSENFTDLWLEANLTYLEAKDLEHRYALTNVPKAIEFATSRFAAFFIYTTIYNEQQMPGLPSSINDITTALRREYDMSSWINQAIVALKKFIDKYTMFFDPETGDSVNTAPRWWSCDTLFDMQGVAYVGEGLTWPEIDQFVETSEMSYAGLLDWDLMQYGADQYYTNVSSINSSNDN